MEIKEWYQNREDMLELKHINKSTGLNIDYFKPGHPQALRGEWNLLPIPVGAQGMTSNISPHPCLPKQTNVQEARGSAENVTNVPPGKSKPGPRAHSVLMAGHMLKATFLRGQDTEQQN